MSTKVLTLDELLGEKKPETLLKDVSFENGLKLLEELVARVESGSLALDKAILSYERGAALIELLKNHLSGAEDKLRTLQKGAKA
jgi:exodeoxyribonuclease VII small subunit